MQEPDFSRDMIWHAVLEGTLDVSHMTDSDFVGLQLQIMDAILVKKQLQGLTVVDNNCDYERH
jgi:hypothetical protein